MKKTKQSQKISTTKPTTSPEIDALAGHVKQMAIGLTPADYRDMGKLESLYAAAEIFESTKLSTIKPKAVARILRQLADEICSVDSVRAYKIAHAPEVAEEFREALAGVQ